MEDMIRHYSEVINGNRSYMTANNYYVFVRVITSLYPSYKIKRSKQFPWGIKNVKREFYVEDNNNTLVYVIELMEDKNTCNLKLKDK